MNLLDEDVDKTLHIKVSLGGVCSRGEHLNMVLKGEGRTTRFSYIEVSISGGFETLRLALEGLKEKKEKRRTLAMEESPPR
jgi:hypothetical protein